MDNNKPPVIKIEKPTGLHGAKKLALLFIAFLLMAATAYQAYSFISERKNTKTGNNINEKYEENYVSVQKKADKLASEKKYEEAIKAWQEYIDNSPNDNYKESALISQSTIYYNQSKFDKALETAKKARQTAGKDTRSSSLAIAYAASETGDYQLAIDEYKKVIEFDEQTVAKYKGDREHFGEVFQLQNDKDNYQRIIKELEKKNESS